MHAVIRIRNSLYADFIQRKNANLIYESVPPVIVVTIAILLVIVILIVVFLCFGGECCRVQRLRQQGYRQIRDEGEFIAIIWP